MSNSQRLRERASELFALAIKAREHGAAAFADALIDIANDALALAEETEQRHAAARSATTSGEMPVVQLQPQPEDPDKE